MATENWVNILQEKPLSSTTKICLKITCLKFHSNFPGANELMTGDEAMGCKYSFVPPTLMEPEEPVLGGYWLIAENDGL